jgi:hypothetical protein
VLALGISAGPENLLHPDCRLADSLESYCCFLRCYTQSSPLQLQFFPLFGGMLPAWAGASFDAPKESDPADREYKLVLVARIRQKLRVREITRGTVK